jgi:transposase
VSTPQVIDDNEHERVFERVAAVDVAKKDGTVCTRLPHPSGRGARRNTVWTVSATMNAVRDLAGQLAGLGIQRVTLESTSDYWRIWFYVLSAAGLEVQLVSATQVKQLQGRPKTDKLDAMWLARLTEMGLLRPSFVPPAEIRALRDYARARSDLTADRTRCWQRLEKLLEDALIKISSVASKLATVSARAMVEALIAGERDPVVLAGLARSRMRAKQAALIQALEGMFDNRHGQLARMLLDQIDFLDKQIARLTMLIAEQLDQIPAARGVDSDGAAVAGSGTSGDAIVLPAAARLDEIPGISADLAASIIAETGLDMSRFPTPGHLVSWAGLCPRTLQSGSRSRDGRSYGNPYLRACLGSAAIGAAKTPTFLGERYHRLARRRGKAKAQVAVARSILVIIWHLLAQPEVRYQDLGPGWYETKTNKDRAARNHIRQLQALGYTVTLTPAA